MEHILLIDTSADACTVGLSRDGKLFGALRHREQQSQAAAINIMIEQLLSQATVKAEELSAVSVCSGPGSYTGLRIGLATAKGLAFAWNKPLILQHKLELLAQQYIRANSDYWQYGVLITARPGEFFYAAYDAEMYILQQPVHGTKESVQALIDQLSPTAHILVGDAASADAFGNAVQQVTEVDMADWAPWAALAFSRGDFSDVASAVPFYMKEVFVFAPRNRSV